MIFGRALDIAPYIPWSVLGPLLALAAVAFLVAVVRRARGAWWRGLAMAVLAVALLNPTLVEEDRRPVPDVVALVVDESPSQDIGPRRERTDAAVAMLRDRLSRIEGLEVRVVRAGREQGEATEATHLFEALDRAIADVPRRRLAGAILVTDGQVHDVPETVGSDRYGPVHALLTGTRDERDRRLSIVRAPSFGLVDGTVDVTLRVDELGMTTDRRVPVTYRIDGGPAQTIQASPGTEVSVAIPLDHGGQTVIEFEVPEAVDELTLANNRAAVAINAVRDRLRVLLISGEPHPGERTWRNLLKSDPSVDLVHFTILRPPEKQDGTPTRELSLIAFPTRELFEENLDQFDLVIFDRYRRRGLMPTFYFELLAEYVRKGGALLDASGPDFAGPLGLATTPLIDVLPGKPTGELLEAGFRPTLTELGRRHPVTTALTGEADWGRWFRQVELETDTGETVMAGIDGKPLLVLDRVEEGRIAQVASDQVWLWSRGFEGGGPHAELLRRMAHWLMKEPELEEEVLTATAHGSRVDVARRSLGTLPTEAVVTAPSGRTFVLPLADGEPGVAAGSFTADEAGLWRVEDGEKTSFAIVGVLNPVELRDVRATAEPLAPVVEASRGGVFWLAERPSIDVRNVRPDRDAAGANWLGLRRNEDYVVVGARETTLLPVALALLLTVGAFLIGWRREGR